MGPSALSPLDGGQGRQTASRHSLLVGAMAAMASHSSHAPQSSRWLDLQQGQLCPQRPQWSEGDQDRPSDACVRNSQHSRRA